MDYKKQLERQERIMTILAVSIPVSLVVIALCAVIGLF